MHYDWEPRTGPHSGVSPAKSCSVTRGGYTSRTHLRVNGLTLGPDLGSDSLWFRREWQKPYRVSPITAVDGGHKRDASTINVQQWAGFGFFAMRTTTVDKMQPGTGLLSRFPECHSHRTSRQEIGIEKGIPYGRTTVANLAREADSSPPLECEQSSTTPGAVGTA